MTKPRTKTNAIKFKSKNGDGVDRVDSKKPNLADETLLAYALELGSRVAQIQCLPGKRATESVNLGRRSGFLSHGFSLAGDGGFSRGDRGLTIQALYQPLTGTVASW